MKKPMMFFGPLMGGGGGGSSNIEERNPNKELKKVKHWQDVNINRFGNFRGGDQLLGPATTGATNFFNNLPNLTNPLSALQSGLPSFYEGLQGQISGLQGQGQGLFDLLGGYGKQLGGIFSSIPGQFKGIERDLSSLVPGLRRTGNILGNDIANVYQPEIAAGGYSKETDANAAQLARSASSAAGALHTSGAIGQEVLGRQDARDRRLALFSGLANNAAAGQAGSLGAAGGLLSALANVRGTKLGLQTGVTQARAGVAGQQGGILGFLNALTQGSSALKGSEVGQTSGLSSGISNLQTNALNQLLGVGNSAVSQWGGLTNPALGYLGNLFSNNLQARTAEADISAKADAAGGAKASEGIGSILSVVGPIIGAVAMSDERTKTGVKDTGMKTPEGIPLKSFEYKFRPGVRHLGYMAQDIEKKVPGAVFTEPWSGRNIKFIDKVRFPIIDIEAEVA